MSLEAFRKEKTKPQTTKTSFKEHLRSTSKFSSPNTKEFKVKAENLAGNHVLKSTYLSLALQGISHTVLMPYVPQHTGIMG